MQSSKKTPSNFAKSYSSNPRTLLGGYLICLFIGLFVKLCYLQFVSNNDLTIQIALFGALAVGISIFAMVATDTEHPPAAGISLGLILNEWNYPTLIFIILAVVLMILVKHLLKSHLIDLL